MYNRLKTLIENHYYVNAEVAKEKVAVLYSYDRITTDQYNELMELIDAEYGNEDENGTENA